MHHNSAAACSKHLLRATSDVLGKEKTKEIRVSNVRGIRESGQQVYTCYCGKPADFYLRGLDKRTFDEQKGQTENSTPTGFSIRS